MKTTIRIEKGNHEHIWHNVPSDVTDKVKEILDEWVYGDNK